MRRRNAAVLWLSLTLSLVSLPAAAAAPRQTEAPRRPVENAYHGVSVTDDYQWLEKGADPAVQDWSEAQNAGARHYLDHIQSRPDILARVKELKQEVESKYYGLRYVNGRFFALKDQPPKEQPFLVVLESLDSTHSERVIVDPNTIDPTGNTSIDFFVPSLDGALVAVSMSQGGTEDGTVSVFVTASGERLPDSIPRVNGGTAGGSVAWTADGSGFYRTRYPHPGERPEVDLPFYEQVYFHQLGKPAAADSYSFGQGLPRIAEIFLITSLDGRYVLADVLNGDGGEHAFWLLGPAGSWQQVSDFKDECVKARFGVGDDAALYLLSYHQALNGKILRLPLATPELAKAVEIVPERQVAIDRFTPTASRLYIHELVGGPSQVRIVDLRGQEVGVVPVPPVSSVGAIVHVEGDQVVFTRESFTEPLAWYRFDAGYGAPEPTALVMRSPADFSDIEVRRELVTSKDGTQVPINILMRRGTPVDGSAPLLLTGYGGYGISQAPRFIPERRLWLEQGGIIAVANLRGGGEFGEAWHRAGNLTKKQNVFDDFAACARHVVDRRYTSRYRLAAEGGSNGGLLMGAMIVQHPDLFRAVVSHVGVYDMLRVELTPNGEFNTTEYGTVKDPEQFAALRAYSPYHHVKEGTAYPSVLLLTGANDPRVDPMHSRKMTARLQAATASSRPILLRTSATTGHGGGTPLSAENEEDADVYSFLFMELGIPYRTEATAGP